MIFRCITLQLAPVQYRQYENGRLQQAPSFKTNKQNAVRIQQLTMPSLKKVSTAITEY